MSKILVTGGAGYIGSHTCVELVNADYEVVVMDNFSNSSKVSIGRVENITGKSIQLIEGDIRDKVVLRNVFAKFNISSVIHFAGLKSVGESVELPIRYYDNNVSGSVALFEVMAEYDCKSLVFSSSATVYGSSDSVPIKENFPLSTVNPYGASKLMVENILRDIYASDHEWSIGILRYFNPVGAHESGLIGEDPNGPPNNLMPFVSQVAIGMRPHLSVFGADYDTQDGTGVRDYIHVVDLAKGHVKALKAMQNRSKLLTVNLGTGKGYSVLEMVRAFEKASGKNIPYKVVERRPGDVAKCYADPSHALDMLNWKAEFGIDRICEDAWRWQSMNPNGYKS